MDFFRLYDSPIGRLTLVSDGKALTELRLDGSNDSTETQKNLPIFRDTFRWLDIYFSGKEPDFTPPLNMRTGPFRREVWEIMLTIPYGKTMTYGEIAKEIARRHGLAKMSAQAVGGAVGHNAIPIIIISGIVAAARLKLKSHSNAQIYSGFAMGFATVLIIYIFTLI